MREWVGGRERRREGEREGGRERAREGARETSTSWRECGRAAAASRREGSGSGAAPRRVGSRLQGQTRAGRVRPGRLSGLAGLSRLTLRYTARDTPHVLGRAPQRVMPACACVAARRAAGRPAAARGCALFDEGPARAGRSLAAVLAAPWRPMERPAPWRPMEYRHAEFRCCNKSTASAAAEQAGSLAAGSRAHAGASDTTGGEIATLSCNRCETATPRRLGPRNPPRPPPPTAPPHSL